MYVCFLCTYIVCLCVCVYACMHMCMCEILFSHADLPGVEVTGRTSFIATNLGDILDWREYGFRLTVPADSLPAGVDQCPLDIVASTAGQYQFPDDLQLVSGVFWVRPGVPGRFRQQLTVEIQHCAKMTSSTKLSFVRARCSQESLPYSFRHVEGGGSFTEYSSYGLLKVARFSGLAIAGKKCVRNYTARLYYYPLGDFSARFDIPVSWNDKAHISVS